MILANSDIETSEILWLVVYVVLGIALAALPIWLARRKGHQATGIAVLSILGFFTGITWLIALVWSMVLPDVGRGQKS